MHFNTAKLLTYHPYPALLLMTNQALGLNLNPNQVTVKKIESLGGVKTRVTLGYYDDQSLSTRQRYTGDGTVIYSRIDAYTFLESRELKVRVPTPTSTLDVLAELSRMTGIVFDRYDFEQAPVFGDSVVLVASPTSLRWVGRARVSLIADPDQQSNIAELISVSELNGFYINNINELSPTSLSGFELAGS